MYNTNNLIEELLENPNMIVEGNREETVIAVLGNSDDKKYAKHREAIAMKESEYLEMGYDPVVAVRKAQSYWLKDFLADGVQEEGFLDRMKVRGKSLKSNIATKIGTTITSDRDKQRQYRTDNIAVVSKNLNGVVKNKVIKTLRGAFKDLAILTSKKARKVDPNVINPTDLMARVSEDRNMDVLWDEIEKTIYNNIITVAHSFPLPPNNQP